MLIREAEKKSFRKNTGAVIVYFVVCTARVLLHAVEKPTVFQLGQGMFPTRFPNFFSWYYWMPSPAHLWTSES